MNFLAHAYLSHDSDEALLGSLMGDFVKGPLDARDGSALSSALALHRRIDTYTDAHPIVAVSRSRMSAARRRFAGILVDMFYDHFLARHWPDYSTVPLDRFTARVYDVLLSRSDELPERLRYIAPHMARTDWLGSYRHLEAVGVALDRIGNSLKRGNFLLGSIEELVANYAALEQDFRSFFPEVVRFAKSEGGEKRVKE